MKAVAICGTFDDFGGHSSGFMKKLFSMPQISLFNGGYYQDLPNILKEASSADVIFWFPNIPNDKTKLIKSIKEINPKCILVTSKNNRENKYSHKDIVARALNSKSNLLLEITEKEGKLLGTLHDPLGNVYCVNETEPLKIGLALEKRIKEISSFTRIRSVKAGDTIEVPDEVEFFSLIKGYADRFHELIHAVNSERLLGNASFRCARGFPGFRNEGKIFVSQRNIDKRFIGRDGFVAVEPEIRENTIFYYGDVKPSVDTPIQIRLFEYYTEIKYILHSHTYINTWYAPYTRNVIPCGALEEFDHIKQFYPDRKSEVLYMNLLGHGSLVMAKDLSYFKDLPYIARPTPEVQ